VRRQSPSQHGQQERSYCTDSGPENALFCDDEVRVELEDAIDHRLDLLFLDLIDARKVGLLRDLDICLALSFFIFERTVEEPCGFVYATMHLRVHDILVEHDTRQNSTALDLSSQDFLYMGIVLNVDRAHACIIGRDDANGLEHSRWERGGGDSVWLSPHPRWGESRRE
jgi:hypothetical protein